MGKPAAKLGKPAAKFTFAAVQPAAPAPAKAKKANAILVEGVADFAAVRCVQAMLTTVEGTLRASLKTAAAAMCVKTGCVLKSKPENVSAYEEEHTASLIFSKRTTLSVLSDDEAAILDEHKIPYTTKTVQPEGFLINQDALADPKVRAQVEKAINSIPNWQELNLILPQPAITKRVVSDATVNAIFQQSPEVCERLLDLVTSFRLRANFALSSENLMPLIERVSRLIGLPTLREAVLAAANDPEKVLSEQQQEEKGKKAA